MEQTPQPAQTLTVYSLLALLPLQKKPFRAPELKSVFPWILALLMSPLCIAFCICSINDVYGAEHYRAPVEALAPKQIIPEGKKVHSLLFPSHSL